MIRVQYWLQNLEEKLRLRKKRRKIERLLNPLY